MDLLQEAEAVFLFTKHIAFGEKKSHKTNSQFDVVNFADMQWFQMTYKFFVLLLTNQDIFHGWPQKWIISRLHALDPIKHHH